MYRMITLAAVALLTLTACGSNDSQAPQHSASLSKALKEQPVIQQETVVAEVEVVATVVTAEATGSEEPAQTAVEQNTPESVETTVATEQPTTAILTVRLTNDYGSVLLTHSDHVEMMGCDSCHTTNPPSKIKKTKKEFHALCRKCHVDSDAGPTKCRDCHKRQ
ncbi:MAG: cytochrome c3 family protein [Desulfuromonas sp.]|nr:cytochrome c3 family protein [Desulfuromonas sp.]